MIETVKEEENLAQSNCEHYMAWSCNGGHSVHICMLCGWIDMEATFKDYIKRSDHNEEQRKLLNLWNKRNVILANKDNERKENIQKIVSYLDSQYCLDKVPDAVRENVKIWLKDI
jgi:hypothetical protein